MRLFVSYARVDRPFCEQIVQTLEAAHEVWYDRRLQAGKNWWEQIKQKLDWCEGFIYLLSPESLESEYCQKEYAIVRKAGKPIFPVKIQSNIDIPADLLEIQIADFSEGLTPEAVTILLSGIYVVERDGWREQAAALPAPDPEPVEAPVVETESEGRRTYDDAMEAYHDDDLDRALFGLLQVKESDYHPPFIDLDSVIAQVKGELNHRVYMKEARRAYDPILKMVTRERTRQLGCQAFAAFREEFPDYDPDGIAETCEQEPVPHGDINVTVEGDVYGELNVAGRDVVMDKRPSQPASADLLAELNRAVLAVLPEPFEWCEIPGNHAFKLLTDDGDLGTYFIEPFFMAKYPITYAQFQVFADASDGFDKDEWWKGLAKREEKPGIQEWQTDDHPRENVSWYDAVAFCRWLTSQLGHDISLSTEWEWHWAAQGNTAFVYPWGSDFDATYANTSSSGFGQTTPVTQYMDGASPFGVVDMAGNIWEWCFNNHEYFAKALSVTVDGDQHRSLRGGSWYSSKGSARIESRGGYRPHNRSDVIGFRVACYPRS